MQGRTTETLDGETTEMTGLEMEIRQCVSGYEGDVYVTASTRQTNGRTNNMTSTTTNQKPETKAQMVGARRHSDCRRRKVQEEGLAQLLKFSGSNSEIYGAKRCRETENDGAERLRMMVVAGW
ncbi:hypothetical protein AAHE18_19G142000 [Arachis hypogaea]|uniref:Uncharacterized protein n=1 Tax=Arachis hypogaea TaxID=3818 RepID=A0A6B9VAV5_ARAHY|nr:uncharacterized protein DS421_19g656640 [Arachis hypogaea]